MYFTHKKTAFFVLALLLTCLVLLFSHDAAAQGDSRQFMATWQAESYTPPEYRGKALPIPGAPVTVSVELIEDGRLVDLSDTEVRWLVNNRDLIKGIGLQTITFNTSVFRSVQKVMISLVNSDRSITQHLVNIPTIDPQLVIKPLSSAEENTYSFKALPYFFTAEILQNLLITWNVDGDSISSTGEEATRLDLDVSNAPENSRIRIEARAQNTTNTQETATAFFTIEI